MAMNMDQVKRRRAKVRTRIKELQLREATAATDRHWFRSRAFKDYARRNRADRLNPVITQEQYPEWLSHNGRAEQVRDLVESVAGLPDHAGTRVLNPHPARVAMIADTFLYETYEGTANITYVTPENFRDVARTSDVLILTSTWRGRFEDWHGTTASAGLVRSEVIPAFRARDVPVIFYSKEDPPNYARFRPLAQEADVIFTSAQEMIPSYAADCPEVGDIRPLTFGVNPLLHTPVGSRRVRHSEVLFAGSWLSHKYHARQSAARFLFSGVLDAGRDLLIVDRNSSLGDPKYFYPREFVDHVGPGLGHRELMKVQRSVDVHLNLNSVTNSGTMYANRVVELQAMGAFVLSNYSLAVNDRYPEVQLIDRPREVPLILDGMTGERLYRAQSDGLRRVWEHDTAWQRMSDMLSAVGAPVASLHERVAVVPDGDTTIDHAREIADTQTALVSVLTRGELAQRRDDFDVVVPVSDDHDYASGHVRDLLNVFRYADVDVATKNGFETNGGITSLDDHELTGRVRSSARSGLRVQADTPVLQTWLDSGRIEGRAYSTAPFGAGPRVGERIEVTLTDAPQLTVVVPVFNNGKHLVSKCFRSLERSTIFRDMEILLIDDGSTDHDTVLAVRELAARYDNVRAHFFETGGSGSASRPRNEGLKLATAPYITYLDPDNEALNDGFRVLLETVRELGVQFAIGDMIKLSSYRRHVPNVKILTKNLPEDPTGGLMVPEDALQRINFQPMSIQALVADTHWLRAIGLHQPVGALGQDSLAFQQMLHGARRIATVRLPIHVYYGAVSNSMINTVGPSLFRKYLPLEHYRVEWLRREGLYDAYCHTRVDAFFDGWLVNKFNRFVPAEQKAECRALLDELCALYEVELTRDDPQEPASPLRVVPRPAEEQLAPADVLVGAEN
ncbi:glycosyltransferase [Kocuria marina]|uniref:glycosyltransferase n=1 Tax=Kocuria marina TaxID=223184 RepID=UPI001F150A72|nr:glycosyltransferase [Kocuria indica]